VATTRRALARAPASTLAQGEGESQLGADGAANAPSRGFQNSLPLTHDPFRLVARARSESRTPDSAGQGVRSPNGEAGPPEPEGTALTQLNEALRMLLRAREQASTTDPKDAPAAAAMVERAQYYLTLAAKNIRREAE
jgi:hypothetical protein